MQILSRNPRLYSTSRLVEAGQTRGHQVDVIDTILLLHGYHQCATVSSL